jgi:hypothetical protein
MGGVGLVIRVLLWVWCIVVWIARVRPGICLSGLLGLVCSWCILVIWVSGGYVCVWLCIGCVCLVRIVWYCLIAYAYMRYRPHVWVEYVGQLLWKRKTLVWGLYVAVWVP